MTLETAGHWLVASIVTIVVYRFVQECHTAFTKYPDYHPEEDKRAKR